jgi:hypothetical protein
MNELVEKKEILVDIVTPPEIVLQEAQKAAQALTQVIKSKSKPVIIRGEQYLEFEDWQTVGRFYGLVPKVVETKFIQLGDAQGFEARATVIRLKDGMEISAAEAMCLNDEPNWKDKPIFMLKSMSQTRACAKALRNVLAWVVVLAGYKPTPAEEVIELESGEEKKAEPISEAQKGYILGISKKRQWTHEDMIDIINSIIPRHVEKLEDLTKNEASHIITNLKKEPY